MSLKEILQEGLDFFEMPSTGDRIGLLEGFLEELVTWNRHFNLVGFRDAGTIARELMYDAFFLARQSKNAEKILDLGSGSGIVAVTIAVLVESAKVISLDKSEKKIEFQKHIRRSLKLKNLAIIHGRAEDVEPPGVDCLIAKAYGTIDDILRVARRHVKNGGRVLAVKGPKEEKVVSVDFLLEEVIPYRLPGSGKEFRLFIWRSHQA